MKGEKMEEKEGSGGNGNAIRNLTVLEKRSNDTNAEILTKVKNILATDDYNDLKVKKENLTNQKIHQDEKLSTKKKNKKTKKRNIFGYELIMDLFECDQSVITSKKKLQMYVDKLCKLIKMKKFGKTLIPLFGANKPHTKGYSLVQLIETSSITGHFSQLWNTAYINIFSCKAYNHKLAAQFTKKFFGAKRIRLRFLVR
ncbi:MAG: S-adenosylmethionine decarboxylase [Candidatus Omnitrophica bacterium]|nr:S-adenosylmethionine decarboxylase [Candidatus Omnitrophota bacterium]